MARFPIVFAQTHNPLFMNGNLGDKLNPEARTGMRLTFDTELRALLVEYQGRVSLVFEANIASAIPANLADVGLDAEHHSPVRNVIGQPQPNFAGSVPAGRGRGQPQAPIIQPTAPHAPIRAMAPQMPPPQPRTAQVSHPAHDAVHGQKLTAPPKYMAHSPMEVQRAAQLAASGSVMPGAAAPTLADLNAAGYNLPVPAAPVAAPPAKAPRARKPAAPKVGE